MKRAPWPLWTRMALSSMTGVVAMLLLESMSSWMNAPGVHTQKKPAMPQHHLFIVDCFFFCFSC